VKFILADSWCRTTLGAISWGCLLSTRCFGPLNDGNCAASLARKSNDTKFAFAATPMAYDIAAIQYLYGANMTYNTGNNVYLLPDSNDPHPFIRGAPNEVGEVETIIYQPDTAFWSCIWDAGGIDEIRYDVIDPDGSVRIGERNAIIDLTAATLDYSETGYGVLSYAAFIGGGYTIANGVVIENATGGNGNDELTGNQVANVLTGRGGNDMLYGKAGADTIDGGDGVDTALFSGLRSGYTIKALAHGFQVSGPDGIDTLYNMEKLAFDDVTVVRPTADLSGDFHSDLLWQTKSGQVAVWAMDGEQITSAAYTKLGDANVGSPGAGWHIVDTADFNGDGTSDVLWNTDSGQVAIWEMIGTQVIAADFTKVGASNVGAPGADWHLLGTSDFDGDGKSDLLWETSAGQVAIWEMDGAHVKSADYIKLGPLNVGAPSASWHIVGSGDFDGDGKSDLLWRTDSGNLAVWEMDGTQIKSADYTTTGGTIAGAPGANWHIVDTGDFNGDGKSDLLWRTDAGQVAIWEMDGAKILAADYTKMEGSNVGSPGANWHLLGASDYNGDGKSDLLWQTDGGNLAVWEMDGTRIEAASYVGTGDKAVGAPGADWSVIHHHYELI